MVGQLVAQGSLHLPGQQLGVVAEVALERVAVDDDPVLVPFSRDPVAEVLAVGPVLGATIGDDHRHLLQQLPEFLGQGVDRVCDQGFELVRLGFAFHATRVRGGLAKQPCRHFD